MLAASLGACSASSSAVPPAGSATSSTTTAAIGGASTPATPSPSGSLDAKAQAERDVEAGYRTYRETVTAVFQAGGKDADTKLAEVAFGQHLDQLLQRAARYQRDGLHVVASAAIRSLDVKSVNLSSGKLPQGLVIVCFDSTNAKVVDRAGKSVTSTAGSAFFHESAYLIRVQGRGWLVGQVEDSPVKAC